jgi:hypothetical protein
MIHAQLHKSRYDEEIQEFSWEPLAELVVENDGSHHGEHVERFGLRKALLDPETRERVVFTENPERWVRLLPMAYRTGDVTVAILHDDHPHAAGTAATGEIAVT